MEMDIEAKEAILQIQQLLKALLRSSVSEKLAAIHADKTLRTIFEMTGNGTTVKQVATKAKVSTWKVSVTWQSWEDAGLVVKDGKSYKKLV